jgi:ribose 5-phosphate isomerase A
MTTDQLKELAAEYAVTCLRSGMVVGLGHGSTAVFAVRRIAVLLREGTLADIRGIPCSAQVEAEARALGIPLTTLEDVSSIDVTIDGADEVVLDSFAVLKGGGGALLREKIVAEASAREIIIVDGSKVVDALGTRFPVPVEVAPFGRGAQARFLESLGARVALREGGGTPFRTDEGHFILDAEFGLIPHPATLATALEARAGILEHGLFLTQATDIVIADTTGIRHLIRPER